MLSLLQNPALMRSMRQKRKNKNIIQKAAAGFPPQLFHLDKFETKIRFEQNEAFKRKTKKNGDIQNQIKIIKNSVDINFGLCYNYICSAGSSRPAEYSFVYD